MSRAVWGALTEAQLLAQCEVDTYRASGPGGQKRNKTSSAVRLRHPPSGLLVIAEESRSQHENKAKALQRLRQAFFLKLREPMLPDDLVAEALLARPEAVGLAQIVRGGYISPKEPRYWPMLGLVLDVLEAGQARLRESAECLGLSTGKLIDLLQTHPKVWEQACTMRQRFGQKPLRSD